MRYDGDSLRPKGRLSAGLQNINSRRPAGTGIGGMHLTHGSADAADRVADPIQLAVAFVNRTRRGSEGQGRRRDSPRTAGFVAAYISCDPPSRSRTTRESASTPLATRSTCLSRSGSMKKPGSGRQGHCRAAPEAVDIEPPPRQQIVGISRLRRHCALAPVQGRRLHLSRHSPAAAGIVSARSGLNDGVWKVTEFGAAGGRHMLTIRRLASLAIVVSGTLLAGPRPPRPLADSGAPWVATPPIRIRTACSMPPTPAARRARAAVRRPTVICHEPNTSIIWPCYVKGVGWLLADGCYWHKMTDTELAQIAAAVPAGRRRLGIGMRALAVIRSR